MPKFEDEFDELVKTLGYIFNQRHALIPVTMLQRRIKQVLREDRYTVLSYNDRPRFAVVDVRLMNKVRKLLVEMGYIKDRNVFEEDLPDPKNRPKSLPDTLTFHIGVENGQDSLQTPPED